MPLKKGYTFWEKDFDGMGYKTMLRQLISKWGIMSIEMQNAYEGDMASLDGEKKNYIDNDVDDIPDTTSPQSENNDIPEAEVVQQVNFNEI